jgi:WD40 repeat protein
MNLFEGSVIGADWKDRIIAAGSREGQLAIIDIRDDELITQGITVHSEEVCSVKLHPDQPIVATSGNECTVKIWDLRMLEDDKPLRIYSEHEAAVRAMTWSPSVSDVIVTGGGTADKCIRMWNITTGENVKVVDTGSQVCNLYWNLEYNEILSSHGYSQNQLALWKGNDLAPIASFHQHKQRVLYMCVSPDGSTVATAAANDSFQIWKMFPPRGTAISQSFRLIR